MFVITYIVYLFQIYFLFVSSYFPAYQKEAPKMLFYSGAES